jgi:NAD kinase
VQIDQGIGTVNASGIKTVTPTSSTAYTLTATNPSGWVSQTITISVVTYIPGLKLVPIGP